MGQLVPKSFSLFKTMTDLDLMELVFWSLYQPPINYGKIRICAHVELDFAFVGICIQQQNGMQLAMPVPAIARPSPYLGN